jgi:glucose/arabinose dehydrogenase
VSGSADYTAPRREILLEDLARIRDVETGPDGAIYLLLEHASGGQIVGLVPVDRSV